MAGLIPAPSRNGVALNCGSSSLKFGLYAVAAGNASLICEGEAEEIGGGHGQFWFRRENSAGKRKHALAIANHEAALHLALGAMKACGVPDPDAAGHRFVHGGPRLREHRVVQPEVVRTLEESVAYTPLHTPAALAVLST